MSIRRFTDTIKDVGACLNNQQNIRGNLFEKGAKFIEKPMRRKLSL